MYSDSGFGSYHSGAPVTGGVRDASNEYTRLTQVISKNVTSMTQNVAQMQRMVTQIGTAQDNPGLRDRLHQIQHFTNQLAKDTGRYLKDLSALPQPDNQSEMRQRKMQKERLMNDFSSTLQNFQATQRQAAEKERASMARARASSGHSYGDKAPVALSGQGGDPFVDDRRSDDLLVNPVESPTQTSVQMENDVDLELLQEREQAIKQLESDIMDVNQIFKDLGMLVHEQGEVIDSIEANVESTAVHVEQGRQQLSKAQDYQTKARRKKCICIIVLVVALIIIAIIIGVSVHSSS